MSRSRIPSAIGTPESRRARLLTTSGSSPGAGCCTCAASPEALADATIQPIMFVLLFAYVFGGAIAVPAAATTRSS